MKSNVYFKFMSYKEFETLQFDGLTISVSELKEEIIQKKNLGKKENYDLILSNSQTGEEYKADALIYKNTSVNVARIPVTRQVKRESRRDIASFPQMEENIPSVESITKASNIADMDVSEEEKVRIMVEQSNTEFAHINYTRGSKTAAGPVPRNYVCHRCGQPGHFIQSCPKLREVGGQNSEPYPRLKRSTGIPNSFMRKVNDINAPGVLVTSTGELVVPTIDAEAYKVGKKEKPPFLEDADVNKQEEDKLIPRELLCPICKNILNDAVVAPCCGDSACDDCIRDAILKSVMLSCPLCKENNVSCDGLIANKFIRTAVINYQNEVGYTTVKSAATTNNRQPPLPQNTNLQQPQLPNQPKVQNPNPQPQNLQKLQQFSNQNFPLFQPLQQQHAKVHEQQHQLKLKEEFRSIQDPLFRTSTSTIINPTSSFNNISERPAVGHWLPHSMPIGEPLPIPGLQGAKMMRVLVPRQAPTFGATPPSSTPYTILPHALNYPPPPLIQPTLPLNTHPSVIMYPSNPNHLMPPPSLIQPPPMSLPSNFVPQTALLHHPSTDASRTAPNSVPLSEEEFYREKQRLHFIETSGKQKNGYVSTDSSPGRPPSNLPSRQKDLFEFAADIMYHKPNTSAKRRSLSQSWSSQNSRAPSRSLSRSSSSSSSSYSSRRSSARRKLRKVSRSRSRRRSRSPLHRRTYRRSSRSIHRSPYRRLRRRPSYSRSRSFRRSTSSRSKYRKSHRRFSSGRSTSRRRSSRDLSWMQHTPPTPPLQNLPPHSLMHPHLMQAYPPFHHLPPAFDTPSQFSQPPMQVKLPHNDRYQSPPSPVRRRQAKNHVSNELLHKDFEKTESRWSGYIEYDKQWYQANVDQKGFPPGPRRSSSGPRRSCSRDGRRRNGRREGARENGINGMRKGGRFYDSRDSRRSIERRTSAHRGQPSRRDASQERHRGSHKRRSRDRRPHEKIKKSIDKRNGDERRPGGRNDVRRIGQGWNDSKRMNEEEMNKRKEEEKRNLDKKNEDSKHDENMEKNKDVVGMKKDALPPRSKVVKPNETHAVRSEATKSTPRGANESQNDSINNKPDHSKASSQKSINTKPGDLVKNNSSNDNVSTAERKRKREEEEGDRKDKHEKKKKLSDVKEEKMKGEKTRKMSVNVEGEDTFVPDYNESNDPDLEKELKTDLDKKSQKSTEDKSSKHKKKHKKDKKKHTKKH